MARQPGVIYPSDKRRWFRVRGTVGEETAALTDAEFRAHLLLMAEANEQRAQENGNCVVVARSRLVGLAPNRRNSYATAARVVRELCAKLSWQMHEGSATVTICIRNYAESQGYAPTQPPLFPDETPSTTDTPTPIGGSRNRISKCISRNDSARSKSGEETARPDDANQRQRMARVAAAVKGLEGTITSHAPVALVDRLRGAGYGASVAWAGIVQSRGKKNPAGFLVQILGAPAHPVSDEARVIAAQEMREAEYA